MRGAEAITAARLDGMPITRIDIELLAGKPEGRRRWTPPGLEVLGRSVIGRIEVYADDNPLTLDLRCCYGLPVLVLAESYDTGWPVAERAIDCEPVSLHFAVPDYLVRYANGRMDAWSM